MLIARSGYEVRRCVDGVYHLATLDGLKQYIALLYALAPMTLRSRSVKFALFELEPEVRADDVLEHWRNLDARRLGGPCVTVVDMALPKGVCVADEALAFVRPRGPGIRHAVRLTTGDIVCYN